MVASERLYALADFVRVHADRNLRSVQLWGHARVGGLVEAVAEGKANPVGNAGVGKGIPDCVVSPAGEGAGVDIKDYIEETGGTAATAVLWGGGRASRSIGRGGGRAGGA